MIRLKRIIIGLLPLLAICNSNAQVRKYECIIGKQDTLIKDIRFYGGLVHQHQDFFHKAFSFQGVETGVMINHTLLVGAYGALFVSNLEAIVAGYPHIFVNIKEAGLIVGNINNDSRVLHTGWLLNMGYFSLSGDVVDFAIFHKQSSILNINGLVLSPQVFTEMNITRWMKLRTGLSYSFYSFEDQSKVSGSDLNTVSLPFGFIFGKFN